MPVLDDDAKIEPIAPIDLDSVHLAQVRKLESEDADAVDEDEDTDAADDTADEDDKADDKKEDDAEDEDEAAPVVPEPVAPKVEEAAPDEPVIDTDITKDGAGKVAVKDAEGNTFYFNNTGEIPDDFEPASYKELMLAGNALARKEISDETAAREAETRKEAQRQQEEIDAVTNSWDKDIDVMTKGGMLPADDKERETAIGDTYAYIAKNLADGVIIDSFAQAHKAMLYDREQEAKVAADKKAADTKKNKGAKVLSGSGGISGKPKVYDSLPPGTSLDAVHAHFSGLK